MKKWLIALTLLLAGSSTWGAETTAPSPQEEGETITFWFVRHGKTLLNTLDRVQGWADSPLTEEGKQVARYLGEGLKPIAFDGFYTSDAGRQRETMQIILQQAGKNGIRPIELPGLREVFFGSFEGGLNKDMAAAGAAQLGLPDAAALFAAMKAGTLSIERNINAIAAADPAGQAETYQQVKARTQAALQIMIENALREKQKNVLAISSGSSIQIMISDLTTNPQKNKPLANSSVVKLIYHNGKIEVTEIGDLSWIAAGKKALEQASRH
ncbi:histidine phosphatase family protein [Mixta tenebrionis]|uniref:Histidine phosphatase family protein n=1 Tax=Mixta tenebrionis TaxID=2562439 RepID=A0A506V5M0_9GAMM|nr:histidine phosphatase family protein [Mixta tenebrionis]TPW40846.1 histidine phosphatase family protein [Mixta tenebrionis]